MTTNIFRNVQAVANALDGCNTLSEAVDELDLLARDTDDGDAYLEVPTAAGPVIVTAYTTASGRPGLDIEYLR